MIGCVDAFEEAGLLRELIGVWITLTRRLPLLRGMGRRHQSSLGRSSMMASGCSTTSPGYTENYSNAQWRIKCLIVIS